MIRVLHVFLLQSVFDKMTFFTEEKLRGIRIPESAPEDTEPWKKLFFVVQAAARPALSICLGWGDGKPPKEGERSESQEKNSTGKKKKRGMKPMGNKKGAKGKKRS